MHGTKNTLEKKTKDAKSLLSEILFRVPLMSNHKLSCKDNCVTVDASPNGI